ncbi:MAG TPA: TlpA disulfide reductase family protein [Candidatus Dormibacteraeota bacterium]|nr:TlpA disulfide reductase family protein [Candidatus Dormibacteraeota bacterium]
MKRSLLGPAIAFVIVLGAVIALQVVQRGPATGYAAVDFTLPDLSGAPLQLSDLRGKIVFLNLWATWCPPCRAEMPSMQALYGRLKGRDFAMIAVAEDTNAADVGAFVKELGLTFPVLLDTGNRLPARFGVTGYPETFIIDRDGQVIKHVIGPEEWTSPNVLAYFEELLGPANGVTGNQ